MHKTYTNPILHCCDSMQIQKGHVTDQACHPSTHTLIASDTGGMKGHHPDALAFWKHHALKSPHSTVHCLLVLPQLKTNGRPWKEP